MKTAILIMTVILRNLLYAQTGGDDSISVIINNKRRIICASELNSIPVLPDSVFQTIISDSYLHNQLLKHHYSRDTMQSREGGKSKD